MNGYVSLSLPHTMREDIGGGVLITSTGNRGDITLDRKSTKVWDSEKPEGKSGRKYLLAQAE